MTAQYGYHVLREGERRTWDLAELRRALDREDDTLAARVERYLQPARRGYEGSGGSNLVEIRRVACDDAIARLCDLYDLGSPVARAWIRSRIDERTGWTLMIFSRRWAVLGARARSEAMLRQSLVAQAIEDLASGDARDNLVTLALPMRCAAIAGLDAESLFRDAAQVAGPAINQMLCDFAARAPEQRSVGVMGFAEVQTPAGVGFQ